MKFNKLLFSALGLTLSVQSFGVRAQGIETASTDAAPVTIGGSANTPDSITDKKLKAKQLRDDLARLEAEIKADQKEIKLRAEQEKRQAQEEKIKAAKEESQLAKMHQTPFTDANPLVKNSPTVSESSGVVAFRKAHAADYAQLHKGANFQVEVRLIKAAMQDTATASEALNLSKKLVEQHPNDESAWDLRAYVVRRSGDPYEALAIYTSLVKRYPQNKEFQKGLTMVLDDMGMPHLALENADRMHVILMPEEYLRLYVDKSVRNLRWAEQNRDNLPERFKNADIAISGLNDAILFAQNNGLANSIPRIRADLIVAYNLRNSWTLSIDQYDKLKEIGYTIPNYAKFYAAESYSSLYKYDVAEPIYKEVVAADPDWFEAQMAYFYCVADNNQFVKASEILDGLISKEEAKKNDLAYKVRTQGSDKYLDTENYGERYTELLTTKAWLSAYQEKYGDAMDTIDGVLKEAPGYEPALLAKGQVELWRENPMAAQAAYAAASTNKPDHTDAVEATAGLANSRLDQGDSIGFKDLLAKIPPGYESLNSVKDVVRRNDLYDSGYIVGDFEFANGNGYVGSTSTNNSVEGGVKGYTSPYITSSGDYRAFASYRGIYSGPSVNANNTAFGGGINWTGINHTLEAEAGSAGYLRASGEQTFSDHLSAGLSVTRNAYYLLPGSYTPVTTGTVGTGTVKWRNNDTQEIQIGYSAWDLPSNTQSDFFAEGTQRVLTQYRYKLDATTWFSNQRNSNPAVGYFAPSAQNEYNETLTLQVLQWRDPEVRQDSFWHKIWGTYGVVTQSSFSTLPMNSYGYGQIFSFNKERSELSWGVAKTTFPFDGAKNQYVVGYLTFKQSL